MPVEQILISAQQKRSRPAGRIENPQALRLFRGFAIQQFAHGVFNDILHDISGRVKDAARFFDFRLVFHDGAVIAGETNNLAQKLFINLPQNIGGQNGKLVGRIGIVKCLENILERLVVNDELGRQLVGRLRLVFFRAGNETGRSCSGRRPCKKVPAGGHRCCCRCRCERSAP